ncbi:MAG: DUF3080 family protein [Pseudomonadales bacterium]
MSGWISASQNGVWRSLALTVALALCGCQPSTPDAVLEDYVDRIARITSSEAALAELSPGPPYPSRRALTLEIPARTIDVAEFFELHGCDMGALVGFRNSPLGRVQSASQRLGYEVSWLAAADRCGADAAEWLAALGVDKRAMLPALFWNATFAEDEFRVALGAAGAAAPGDLADLLRGLNDSLTGVLDGGFDVAAFERRLGLLRQGSWAGPARGAWAHWRRHLDRAAALLARATPGICRNRRPNVDTGRLQNVFRKFYVDRIQPDLAARMRRDEAWIVELERLAQRLAAVRPAAYRQWFDQVLAPGSATSEWRRTRQSVIDHARAWQALFEFCGIEPGGGVGQD